MLMFALDLPTALVMTVMSTLTMATCLVLVGGRQRQDGLGLWGTALLLQALAYSLLALRGQVPDVASIVLANGLLASMYACVLAAIHRFQGRSLPWLWLVLPVMANLALFTAFQDHYPMRVLLAGCLYPLQIARMLWSLYQPGHVPVGRGPLLVALGAVLQVVLLIWRATALPWDQPSAQGGLMRDSGLVQSLTFLSTFISIQVSSLGFIFMAKDRADEDNRHLAAVDPLTGVANRRTLITTLEREIARAVRTRQPLAVMMVDVDHFKRINDTHGHPVGDQVLCEVVAVLRARVRLQDLVGRYGGEEFMVILPDTPLAGAEALARQLCQSIATSRCQTARGELAVSVSIGVAGGPLAPDTDWAMLLSAADQALYRAKENGRNRVELSDSLHPLASPADEPSSIGQHAVPHRRDDEALFG